MKTKTTLSTPLAPTLLGGVALLAATSGLWACAAEFELECPEGTVQTAGGGDVGDACSSPTAGGGSGGAPSGPGVGGTGGGAGPGSTGGGGSGGGVLPVPPGGECNPNATKCEGEAQQTCGADGKWGAAEACAIECQTDGAACVVPVQLAAGISTCARLSDGSVRCWGSDASGELGNGAGAASVRPAEVPGLAGVVDIASNISNACALLSDKTSRCWGSNYFKQIAATGDVAETPTPVGGTGVLRISDSGNHLCVLSEGGKLQCRGSNTFGELGNGSTVESSAFVSVQGFASTPSDVQCASTHSCALLSNGTISCWGAGEYRNGSSSSELTRPKQVPGVGDVIQLSLGATHSCALRKDGIVLCWGSDFYGTLGRGVLVTGDDGAPAPVKNLGDVESISSGVRHVCAVKKDKSLWCWGTNDFGQLGGECGQLGTCQATEEGTRYIAQPVKVPLDNVAEVVAGYNQSCARTADNKVLCWGKNDAGQLGINKVSEAESSPSPVVWK